MAGIDSTVAMTDSSNRIRTERLEDSVLSDQIKVEVIEKPKPIVILYTLEET